MHWNFFQRRYEFEVLCNLFIVFLCVKSNILCKSICKNFSPLKAISQNYSFYTDDGICLNYWTEFFNSSFKENNCFSLELTPSMTFVLIEI